MVLATSQHWDAAAEFSDDIHDANCVELVMDPRWNRPTFNWTSYAQSIHYTPHHRQAVYYSAEPGFSLTEVKNERMMRSLSCEFSAPFADNAADGIVIQDFVGKRIENALVRLTSVDARFPYIRSPYVHEMWVQNFSHSGGNFTLGLGGLRARLGAARGDTLGLRCVRDLGDFGCGVPLDNPTHPHFTQTGAVFSNSPDSDQMSFRLRFQPLASTGAAPLPQTAAETAAFFQEDWFAFGKLRGTQGENQGQLIRIESSTAANLVSGGAYEIDVVLYDPMPFALNGLEQFTLYVGCDKADATCGDKFDNRPRHRGQPYLEGTDSLLCSCAQDGLFNSFEKSSLDTCSLMLVSAWFGKACDPTSQKFEDFASIDRLICLNIRSAGLHAVGQ